MSRHIIVSGPFDDLRLADFRYLHEASRGGALRVLLWSDAAVIAATGNPPKFPAAEREYLLGSLKCVDVVEETDEAVRGGPTMTEDVLSVIPPAEPVPINPPGRKVLVTGCYDWFHSGHVRFFEECAALGELYVGVGSDRTIEQLKGKGHPLFPQDQRRYIVSLCRFVTLAFVNSGDGWLDAEPELQRIRPQIYAVNEDGDKPAKRAYCQANGIEYRVLKRIPKSGLPARQSTALRGY